MVPADQRLDADQGAGGAIDLRLIANLQLALGQRQAQLGLGLPAQPQLAVHAGLEEAEAVPAAVLGPVQSHVGPLQQLRGVMPVGRHHRDADAHRHLRLAPVQIERLRQHGDDPSAQALDVRRAVDVGLQHGEFVAALTGHAVAAAQAGRAGARRIAPGAGRPSCGPCYR